MYDLAEEVLDLVASTGQDDLDTVALGAMWAAVSALGFAPRSDACAKDGRALEAGDILFSVADGGFLCPACARGLKANRLTESDRATLEHLISGSLDSVGALSAKHAAAHRRLLSRFIERHVAEGR